MTLKDFQNGVNEAREHLRQSDVPVYKPNYVLEFISAGSLFVMFYIIYIILYSISS